MQIYYSMYSSIQSIKILSSRATAKLDESPQGTKLFEKTANTVYLVMRFGLLRHGSPVVSHGLHLDA